MCSIEFIARARMTALWLFVAFLFTLKLSLKSHLFFRTHLKPLRFPIYAILKFYYILSRYTSNSLSAIFVYSVHLAYVCRHATSSFSGFRDELNFLCLYTKVQTSLMAKDWTQIEIQKCLVYCRYRENDVKCFVRSPFDSEKHKMHKNLSVLKIKQLCSHAICTVQRLPSKTMTKHCTFSYKYPLYLLALLADVALDN